MTSRSGEESGDQDAIVALLWGPAREPTRGPKPTLSVERIAGVAVRIADAEGVGAVSMQRVAAELDVTKMALYRYLTGKAELVAVMVEAAVGEPPDLDGIAGGWRPRLREFARCLSESWRGHPWLPWVTTGERIMGPKETGWVECALGALAGTGLRGAEQMNAAFLIFGHIRNTQSLSTAGTQPWTTDGTAAPGMRRLLHEHADSYPALNAAMDSAKASPSEDNGREFGLQRILDGLEIIITERSRGDH